MRLDFARFTTGWLALVLAGPLAVVPLPAAAAAPAAAPTVAPAASNRADGAVVTLLTGDRVRRFIGSGGEPAVAVEPAAGRERVGFVRESRPAAGGAHLSVVPADALPLLAAGRLDPRLFDVTELTRQGITGGRPLPLIVTYGGSRVARRPLPAGSHVVRALPGGAGTAVLADPGRGPAVWAWLTGAGVTGSAVPAVPGSAPTVSSKAPAVPGKAPAVPGGVVPRALAGGIRTVWLDAAAPAVAAVPEPESYDLTLRLVSRTGHFEAGVAQAVDTVTGAVFGIRPFSPDGTAVIRLPRGRYDINAFDFSADPGNTAQPLAVTLLSAPDVNLAADTAIRLDATAGNPVRAVVDQPAAVLQFGELGIVSGRAAAPAAASLGWLASSAYQLFAVPGRHPTTAHTYAFFFRDTLAAVAPDTDPASPVYQLAFLHRGGIPARTVFRVHDRELARVAATEHIQGAPGTALRADFARLPLPFT
ncbi:MAG TPA: hypothetical protein VMU51_07125, partial [Mycobacteriales bacterium]|nr:hypothetical protein [Mycobacteriales bacterium]